ncbi:S-layer homology domain-containing protein [Paenibacillus sp. GCM10023252]|uniref:S-layer homology domain-containing protein n=1 Tax=Paenibacillus sp. GCM10023252 TaxID=3252649 RepID=UPI003607268B
MNLYTSKSKWAASALALSLLTAGIAPSATLAAALQPATSFTDVKAGFWAEKHIAKLAYQGILTGYDNGQFLPQRSVSQQEAVLIALRFAGLDDEVKQSEAIVFPKDFVVGTFYKSYIMLAFDKGLLDRSEEFALAQKDKGNEWGSKPASREWVTKLMVKAIGEEDLALDLQNEASAFTDRDKIDKEYLGYINAASQLGLIKGVTVDQFDPKANVNRASLATLFSRSQALYPVQYEGEIDGVLTAVGEDGIIVYAGGEERSYELTDRTAVYRYNSEQPVQLEDLELYHDVTVIGQAGQALYIELMGDEPHVKKITGTIDRIIPSSKIIKLWNEEENNTVDIAYDDQLIVKDSAGKELEFSDLTRDSEVVVTQDTFRKSPLALSITVQSSPINKSDEGTIESINVLAGTIKVKDSSDGTSSELTVPTGVIVTWQGEVLSGLADLRVGDRISYEVKNNSVTRINVLQTSEKTVQGQFYSTDGKIISYQNGTKLETKFLAFSVDVKIDGFSGATINDLIRETDQIQLTLDANDKVTKIEVLNRKVETLVGAQVQNFDPVTNLLTVVDSTGTSPESFYLDAKTKVDYNGTSMTLEAVKGLLVKNGKITVGFTGKKVVLLQFVFKYSGSLLSLNTTNNIITLQLDGSSVISLPYNSPLGVEAAGQASSTLNDLRAGDKLTVLLNSTQDKVAAIQVHRTLQYQVASIDLVAKKLKLTGSDGSVVEAAASSLDILDENGVKLPYTELAPGTTVNVGFIGKLPVSLRSVAVSYGIVQSVSSNSVAITDYSGTTTTVALGAGFQIIKNGTTSSSSAALKAGDRVELRRNEKDAVVIAVNSGLTKKFWKYDAAAGQVLVRRLLTETDYKYNVDASTQITLEGGTTGSLSDLKDGDAIILYVYKNKVTEIRKQ